MQVRGRPGHFIRSADTMARLISAKSPTDEAVIRRDAVRRWRQAIDDGLTANAAAQAVGVPRATLYRWEIQPEPKSRRPHDALDGKTPNEYLDSISDKTRRLKCAESGHSVDLPGA